MLPKAISVATSVAIGMTRTTIHARLKEINLIIIHVLNPFPTKRSANFIMNCRIKIPIKVIVEKTKGIK